MSPNPDAIALLKADHDKVKEMFEKYGTLGDRAIAGKQELAGRICRELTVHAWIEEQVFYPRVREAGRKIEDEVLEGLEEHHLIKHAVTELEPLTADNERYDAKVEVLKELVEHHVDEEEADMFPRVRRALDAGELEELGAAMEAARATAPTRIDPDAPDEPTAATAGGRGAAGSPR
ncbi:MAG TPA: hemerythrin domain-containing protein [Candidatus Dormibacteraeota bacterium]|jgi:hemerythrin superfamily protein